MNQFKVGCNFEHELITIADELNSEFKNKAEIKEWFGSSPNYAELTARPQWRLPNISDKEFTIYRKLFTSMCVTEYFFRNDFFERPSSRDEVSSGHVATRRRELLVFAGKNLPLGVL